MTKKKETDYTIHVLIGLFLFACLCSCTHPYKITGTIQEIRGDTLIGVNHSFTVKDAYKWKVGDSIWFKETLKKKDATAIKIK